MTMTMVTISTTKLTIILGEISCWKTDLACTWSSKLEDDDDAGDDRR
jgi:hypothetical protein